MTEDQLRDRMKKAAGRRRSAERALQREQDAIREYAKIARLEHGWSLQKIADVVGLSKQRIQGIVNAK